MGGQRGVFRFALQLPIGVVEYFRCRRSRSYLELTIMRWVPVRMPPQTARKDISIIHARGTVCVAVYHPSRCSPWFLVEKKYTL